MRGLLLPILLSACVGDTVIVNKDSGADVAPSDGTVPQDSGGGDAPGDSATFSPSSFGNALVLWLEGDVGVGADDAGGLTWLDQSPSPVTMTGSALTDTTPNGHVVLNFNATNVHVQTASVTKLELGATDDFVIAVVMQTTSGSAGPPGAFAFFKSQIAGAIPFAHLGDGFVFGSNVKIGGDAPEIWDVTSNLDAGVDFKSSKTLTDGAYHLVTARRVGSTSLRVKMDGLEEVQTLQQPIDISQPAQPLFIGNVFWGEIFNGTFAFKVAEIVVARRAGSFTPQEIGQLEGYLKTKYQAL
jgi:hypothetical protein